jgi:hypothetical protein
VRLSSLSRAVSAVAYLWGAVKLVQVSELLVAWRSDHLSTRTQHRAKMSSVEDLKWFSGNFSWYTAVLAGGFGVAGTVCIASLSCLQVFTEIYRLSTSLHAHCDNISCFVLKFSPDLQLAGLRIRDSTANAESVLQSVSRGNNSSGVADISSVLGWAMLCTFVLAGVILIGAFYSLCAIIAKALSLCALALCRRFSHATHLSHPERHVTLACLVLTSRSCFKQFECSQVVQLRTAG